MEITLTTTIDIPVPVLEDVLTTAIEGGINYWAEAIDRPVRREDLRVEEARILDLDCEDIFILNAEAIGRGIAYMSKSIEQGTISRDCEIGRMFLYHIYSTDEDIAYADATLADAIVQMACFGEVLYG